MISMHVSGDPARRTIDEPRIIEILLLNGWIYEMRAGARAAAEVEARAALERFVAAGLGFARSGDGVRLFDPVELSRFVRWAARERGDRIFEDRYVATGRRMICEPYGAAVVPVPRSLAPQRHSLTLRRRCNFAARPAGSQVRLRLPVPLEDAAVSDIDVAFLPDGDTAIETRLSAERLEVLARVPESGTITIGMRARFTARCVPGEGASACGPRALDPRDAALYTQPSEGMIKVTARVAALAARLAGGKTETPAILRRFWQYMMEDCACASLDYGRIDPDHPLDGVIEEGWYDCRVGSALLVALCRARSIPARLVNGFMLHPTAPGVHTWGEVWDGEQGWLPFDLTCCDMSLGGRDEGWRDLFFGCLNERVAVERPPHVFTGPGALRLPRDWHMLVRAEARGIAVEFRTIDTDALIYRDDMEIERL
jgi:hypothetical protein